MHNPIGIFHSDIGNACSFQNLNIHTNEWNTTISVCASLRLIFSRRCSNVACLLVKIWYVCVCDCKSYSALKKVKTGRIYTYVYVLLTLVLSNNYILKLFSFQQWRKLLVELTSAWLVCLQRRMFLRTNGLGFGRLDWFLFPGEIIMLTYFIIIIKIIINFGFYNLTICILCGNLMVGRANAPLKLLASDRNNLNRLRIYAGWPESTQGVM